MFVLYILVITQYYDNSLFIQRFYSVYRWYTLSCAEYWRHEEKNQLFSYCYSKNRNLVVISVLTPPLILLFPVLSDSNRTSKPILFLPYPHPHSSSLPSTRQISRVNHYNHFLAHILFMPSVTSSYSLGQNLILVAYSACTHSQNVAAENDTKVMTSGLQVYP